MALITVLYLSLLRFFPPPSVAPIEQAFLGNSAVRMAGLLSTDGPVQISLPDPLTFSDFASTGQTRLIFQRIFSNFETSDFSLDPNLTTYPGKSGGILRARWSFIDRKTGGEHVLRVYLYVTPVRAGRSGLGLRITQIRAERT